MTSRGCDYLAERYEPGITLARAQQDTLRLAAAVRILADEGERLSFLGSSYLPEDEAVFSWFRSGSEQPVVAAHERAGVDYDRIVETIALDAQAEPEPSTTTPRATPQSEGARA